MRFLPQPLARFCRRFPTTFSPYYVSGRKTLVRSMPSFSLRCTSSSSDNKQNGPHLPTVVYPFPSQPMHPSSADAHISSYEWACRYSLLNDKTTNRDFELFRNGAFAGRIVSTGATSPDHLALFADWTAFLFCEDSTKDRILLAKRIEDDDNGDDDLEEGSDETIFRLRERYTRYLRVLQGEDPGDVILSASSASVTASKNDRFYDNEGFTRALGDLISRTRNVSGQQGNDLIFEKFGLYFNDCLFEAESRCRRRSLGISQPTPGLLEDYLRRVPEFGKIAAILVAAELASDIFVPDDVRLNPELERITARAIHIHIWMNDVFSYQREMANISGLSKNLVLLLLQAGMMEDEAVETVVKMHNSELSTFQKEVTEIQALEICNDQVKSYLRLLANFVRGTYDWELYNEQHCGKFFPQNVDFVK